MMIFLGRAAVISALGLGVFFSSHANAQSLLPTNLPDVFAFPAPPAGFDPIHASPEALRLYGFPGRPDRLRSPGSYAAWVHHIGTNIKRVAPILERTDILHEAMKPDLALSGRLRGQMASSTQAPLVTIGAESS